MAETLNRWLLRVADGIAEGVEAALEWGAVLLDWITTALACLAIVIVVIVIFLGGWALFLDEPRWLDELTDPIANWWANIAY
jgi:hypothetical protein